MAIALALMSDLEIIELFHRVVSYSKVCVNATYHDAILILSEEIHRPYSYVHACCIDEDWDRGPRTDADFHNSTHHATPSQAFNELTE